MAARALVAFAVIVLAVVIFRQMTRARAIPLGATATAPPAARRHALVPPQVWQDPSVNPALLEKAYAPSRPLPRAAQPKPSNLTPPEATTRRLRRQIKSGEVLVY